MCEVALTAEVSQQLQQCEMAGLEEVQPQQTPRTASWKLPLMWHRGNNGVVYLWQVGFDGDLLRLHGPLTSPTVTRRKVTLNSTGRAIQEQALLEARNKYRNKFYAGYLTFDAHQPPLLKAMKGVPYQEGKVKRWPMLASPKLNGVRMLIRHLGGRELHCLSYLNRVYTHLHHLHPTALAVLSYLPPQSVLDGELYRHGMSFHQITSAVKTTARPHPQLPLIQYHIFDLICPDNPPSEVRYRLLYQAFNCVLSDLTAELRTATDEQKRHQLQHQQQALELVPQLEVHSHEQALQLKAFYVQHGYEGLVLRTMALDAPQGSKEYPRSLYRPGRSTFLYKLKDFIDEEGKVVGVVESEGNEQGTAGLRVQDKRGNVFTVRWGTYQERESWLQQPSLVQGKSFTFKYTELSEYGVPQQPTGIGFRDYE